MEPLKIKFVEYGKVFIRKDDNYIAGDFKVLNFSDPEIRKREKAFRDILRYPDRSSFSSQYGRVSFGLFKNRDFNEYIFVHIQRRRELERAPGITGLPNRGYNQLRFYIIAEGQMKLLFDQKMNFLMSLIAPNLVGHENGALDSEYKLGDYLVDDVGDSGIQSDDKFPDLYDIDLLDNLESAAVQIAETIIDRFEVEKPRLPYLKFSLPPNIHGVKYKLKIIQQVQAIVYPRVGITTFAFDDISEQQVNVLLFDSTPSSSNIIDLESSSSKNSETQSSDLIIGNLDIVYQEADLNILRNSDLSFREAIFFVLFLNKRVKLDEIMFNPVFAKAKPIDRETYYSLILDRFEIPVVKSFMGNSKINTNIKLDLLEKFLERQKNTLLFLDLYFDLPISERLSKNYYKVIADSLQYAELPQLREVNAEIHPALIQLILSPGIRAELLREKRYWSDKKPVNAIETATFLDFGAAKEIIAKNIYEESNTTFKSELTAFALSQSNIDFMHWVIDSLKVDVGSQKLVDYLLARFDDSSFSTKDEIDSLCSIISSFAKGTDGFLSSFPSTVNGKALENRIYGLIEVSAQIVEKVFLSDIIKLGYPELQPKYLEMRKRVPDDLMGYTFDCVRYLFCRISDRPGLEFLERDCKFTKEERMKLALVLASNSELLLLSDIMYILSKAPEFGYVNLARIIIFREDERLRILELPNDVIENFIIAIFAPQPNSKDYKNIEDSYKKIIDRLQIIIEDPVFWCGLLNRVLGNLALGSFRKMIGELKLEIRDILASTDDGKKLLDLNELLVVNRNLINKPTEHVLLIEDILFDNKSLSDLEDDTKDFKAILDDLSDISNGNNKFSSIAKAVLEGAKTLRAPVQLPSVSQPSLDAMDKIGQTPQHLEAPIAIPSSPNTWEVDAVSRDSLNPIHLRARTQENDRYLSESERELEDKWSKYITNIAWVVFAIAFILFLFACIFLDWTPYWDWLFNTFL